MLHGGQRDDDDDDGGGKWASDAFCVALMARLSRTIVHQFCQRALV
jgi:hypothetical protein